MAVQKNKFKFIDLTGNKNPDAPQYSISYRVKSQPDIKQSYEIISHLKENNDVIIELNSSLSSLTRNRNNDYWSDFLNNIRELGLSYNYRKVPSATKPSILEFIFSRGKTSNNEAHEIITYVPDDVWKVNSFINILPPYGAKYYVVKEPEDGSSLINALTQMTDDEKARYFRIIIFDVPAFGNMGINSNYLKASDIKSMLGID
jgi:hypothetical protein